MLSVTRFGNPRSGGLKHCRIFSPMTAIVAVVCDCSGGMLNLCCYPSSDFVTKIVDRIIRNILLEMEEKGLTARLKLVILRPIFNF